MSGSAGQGQNKMRSLFIDSIVMIVGFILMGSASVGCSIQRKMATPISPFKTYEDTHLGITFDYPSNWDIESRSAPDSYDAEIRLRPKGWSHSVASSEFDEPDFLLSVTASDKNFEDAARDAGFLYRENTWTILGRHDMEGEASEIEGKTWIGIMGERPVGIYLKAGGYFGLGWDVSAVLGHYGKRSVVIHGASEGNAAVDHLIRSFEFLDRR